MGDGRIRVADLPFLAANTGVRFKLLNLVHGIASTGIPAIRAVLDTTPAPAPSWSAKADHPRVFVFRAPVKQQKTTENRGWSAFADHDGWWV
jgi:hypothetical protein